MCTTPFIGASTTASSIHRRRLRYRQLCSSLWRRRNLHYSRTAVIRARSLLHSREAFLDKQPSGILRPLNEIQSEMRANETTLLKRDADCSPHSPWPVASVSGEVQLEAHRHTASSADSGESSNQPPQLHFNPTTSAASISPSAPTWLSIRLQAAASPCLKAGHCHAHLRPATLV